MNRIMWSPSEEKDRGRYRIIYLDRQADSGEAEIPFAWITAIDNFGFRTLDGSYIPFHRVETVKRKVRRSGRGKKNNSNKKAAGKPPLFQSRPGFI